MGVPPHPSTSSLVTEAHFFALDPRFWMQEIDDLDLQGITVELGEYKANLKAHFVQFLCPILVISPPILVMDHVSDYFSSKIFTQQKHEKLGIAWKCV